MSALVGFKPIYENCMSFFIRKMLVIGRFMSENIRLGMLLLSIQQRFNKEGEWLRNVFVYSVIEYCIYISRKNNEYSMNNNCYSSCKRLILFNMISTQMSTNGTIHLLRSIRYSSRIGKSFVIQVTLINDVSHDIATRYSLFCICQVLNFWYML